MIEKLPKDYTARGATMDDLKLIVAFLNTCSQQYLNIEEVPLEAIRNEWESPGFNPETDIRLVFTPQGEPVGYVEVWDTANPPVHPWVWWRTHPEHLGSGICAYLLNWADKRAQKAITRCPEGARVAYRSGADSQLKPFKAAMEAHGMTNLRHSFQMRIEMEAPPPEPTWPQGIRLKVFDLKEDDPAEVYRADVEAFRDHFGFVESPFEDGYKRFKHFLLDKESYAPGLWFLAMDDGQNSGSQIAGVCLCRKNSYEDPDMGWVSSLSVRPPWRKRGIGLALLQHSFGEYYRRGFRKVGLGVDGENLTGALRLYKKAGMYIHRQFDLYEKELRPGKEISVESL